MDWYNAETMRSRSYVCGYCGKSLASDKGYRATRYSSTSKQKVTTAYIYICHRCKRPTFFADNQEQTPGSAFGGHVGHIPSEEVAALYEEARDCMKVNAHTAAVMCCRKLLMNVAVARGARENLKFYEYVNYLSDQGFLPPDGKEWVDLIRTKGNEATHEIAVMDREDAEDLITFSEMLLRFIYEYPAMMKARAKKGQSDEYPKNPPRSSPSIPPHSRA